MDAPDREELGIRFGCGALLGFSLVGLAILRWGFWSSPWWMMAMAIAVPLCGYCAMKWGDAFWWTLFDGWPWWRL